LGININIAGKLDGLVYVIVSLVVVYKRAIFSLTIPDLYRKWFCCFSFFTLFWQKYLYSWSNEYAWRRNSRVIFIVYLFRHRLNFCSLFKMTICIVCYKKHVKCLTLFEVPFPLVSLFVYPLSIRKSRTLFVYTLGFTLLTFVCVFILFLFPIRSFMLFLSVWLMSSVR
jgi:hypothetical protein